MRTLSKRTVRLLFLLTSTLLLASCKKKESDQTLTEHPVSPNQANWKSAKSQQMRDTKSRTANSKSNTRIGKGDRVWERLDNQAPRDYSFENVPFHEAVELLLAEIHGPNSSRNNFRICFGDREEAIHFPLSDGEELPETFFEKHRWLNDFRLKESTASNALLQLCNEAHYECRITSFGLLFEAKQKQSSRPRLHTDDIRFNP